MTIEKCVVLLSGGLDSTVNLYQAYQDYEIELVLTFDYGQVAALKEIQCSKSICQKLKLNHRILDLGWIKTFSQSALNHGEIPVGNEIDIESHQISLENAHKVWVPNRNGIFLNIAAGFAEGLGASLVIPGFNWEEAQTFPDNSEEFVCSVNKSLFFSTNKRVQVKCFTLELSKSQIVKEAIKLGVDFKQIWPCYFSGEQWCRQCESCQRFLRAIDENN